MTTMPHEIFQQQLEASSGVKLKLKINNNYHTMVSVRWEIDLANVSIHKMFLQAPSNVMEALACYIRRKDKSIAPEIKAFIDHHLRKLNYSNELDKKRLVTRGDYFDLQKIYNHLSASYFDAPLNLQITWYGSEMKRFRSQVNLGLYSDALKLIKVHRLLDMEGIPGYVVDFIVYHEMLHYVAPPAIDDKGRSIIHTDEFRSLERRFKEYHLAEKWLKDNIDRFFLN